MADHPSRVPSQHANPILVNVYPHPALNQLPGQNLHAVAGRDQQGIYREGVPEPVALQGEMQYPPRIDAPNYNVAHHHPHPPPPYLQVPQIPHVHMHRDDGVAEPVPEQAHPFVPEVQDNYDDYGAHIPAADPPEAFPGVQPYPAPPADMPPAANGLRNLAGRFLNNPGTLVNMLRIEPGRDGRFEVWIALELADIYLF